MTLEGLISDREGEALARLASFVPADQAIVELGSYKGKSTAYLARSAAAPVYAVDLWTLGGQRVRDKDYDTEATWRAFEGQLISVGLRDRVAAIRSDTVQAAASWAGPEIGLLFIDADHSEAAVRADLAAWEPHLACQAMVAFDDYRTRFPGVVAVADELNQRRGILRARVDRLCVIWI